MEDRTEIELDMGELMRFLLKKIWILVASAVICAVVGFFASYFLMQPEYETSTRIYVLSRSSGSVSYADYQISNQIIEDYKVLITGQNVTKEVIRELGLEMTSDQLEKMIYVTAPENTRVLQITIRDTDPSRAMEIANCVRGIASAQIQQIMDVASVNLVYEAELPTEPTGPDVATIVLWCSVLGLIGAIGVLTVIHIMDDTIRTEEDVERYLGICVMGVIPASADMRTITNDSVSGSKRKIARR